MSNESVDMQTAIDNFYNEYKNLVLDGLEKSDQVRKEDNVWQEFLFQHKDDGIWREKDEELKGVKESSSQINDQFFYCFVRVINKIAEDEFFLLSKQKRLVKLFMNVDFGNRKQQNEIRDIISNQKQLSIEEYLEEYDLTIKNHKEEDKIDFYEDRLILNCKYSKSNWVTIYRGFNTRENETIRYSDNKNKSDYYRQIEGTGFSFTTCKYIALGFSVRFHMAIMREILGGYGRDYKDTHKSVVEKREMIEKSIELMEEKREVSDKIKSFIREDMKRDGDLGRISIGRYVVHKDNIFGYENFLREREVVCDSRDAKLIDYHFVSDNNGFSKDFDSIKDYQTKVATKQYLSVMKDLLINRIWKKDYEVSKEQEIIFSKTKK